MIAFIQPLLASLIGLGLLLYGIIHSVSGFPPAQVFVTFWDSIPQMFSLLVFLLCVAAAVTGLVMLVMGIKGMRRRMLELRHMYGRRQHGYGYDQEYGDPRYQ
ncbi:MAG: hypothetical protein WD768_13665 [Phycisphaeraceae bacterium]